MRIRWCISLLFLMIFLSVSAESAVWPTQGGSFARTGSSPFAGPEQGCIVWEFQTGGSVSSSVAIGQAGQIYAACEDGFLYAVDPNGSQVWAYDAASSVTSAPTIDNDGTIYIGTSAGLLHAVDPNGSQKWSAATQGSIYTTPAVVNNLVITGSLDGSLYAFDNGGASAWIFTPGQPDSVIAAPSVGTDGTIYIGRLYDPNVYALDPADGSILWSTDLSHYIIADDPDTTFVHTGYQISPVVHPDGMVLIAPSHDSKLYALDPADGEILWELNLYQLPQKPMDTTYTDEEFERAYGYTDIWSEPVVGPDGTIYVSMDDMFLRAVNPDGTLKWSRRVGMYGGLTMTVDANGLIYGASDGKSVYVIEPDDGTVISTLTQYGTMIPSIPPTSPDEEFLSYPVLGGDGLLYVSSSVGKVYTVQAGNCHPKALHWPGNLSSDQQINIADLARFGQEWQMCLNTIFPGQQCRPLLTWFPLNFPYPKADLNRDFFVNMDDLTLFVEQWLQEEEL